MSKNKQLEVGRGSRGRKEPGKTKKGGSGKPRTVSRGERESRAATRRVRAHQQTRIDAIEEHVTRLAKTVGNLGEALMEIARVSSKSSLAAASAHDVAVPLRAGEVRLELPPGGVLQATVRVDELVAALTPGDPKEAWKALLTKLRDRGIKLDKDAFAPVFDD